MRKTICFILLALLSLFQLAQTKPPAAPPKLQPIITVTLKDGATIHGNLVSIDPANVTVLSTADPKNRTTTITPWPNIKSMSNGITFVKAVYQWRAEHASDMCPTCKGFQTVTCPTCKGTTHDLAARKDCPTCHGAGTIPCTATGCKQGQIPCPGNCLRLSVGTWYKKDGKLWRNFAAADHGVYFISESHLGEVMEIKNGFATGNHYPCPICGGKQTVDCTTCHGTGNLPCPDCSKSNAPPCPDHCTAGQIKCPTCNATGLKPAA